MRTLCSTHSMLWSVTRDSTAVISLWCFNELPNDSQPSGLLEQQNNNLPLHHDENFNWSLNSHWQSTPRSRCFIVPCSSISDTVLSWSFFFFFFQNIPPEDKSCPGLRCQGESRSKKRVRHLDSYSPNQLSVGLYYMCKAKSWSEKTTYYRVLNINTILKYLFFVILILKQVIRRDQLQNHSTI